MIDPMSMAPSIAQGVVSGYATQKGIEKVKEITGESGPGASEEIIRLLGEILNALAPPEQSSINETMQLQPFPSEYIIADDFHNRAHCCIFFFTSTPIRLDNVFGGSYTKTAGPGWVQVDVSGRISTTDSQNHTVIISYRNDAMGASL